MKMQRLQQEEFMLSMKSSQPSFQYGMPSMLEVFTPIQKSVRNTVLESVADTPLINITKQIRQVKVFIFKLMFVHNCLREAAIIELES